MHLIKSITPGLGAGGRRLGAGGPGGAMGGGPRRLLMEWCISIACSRCPSGCCRVGAPGHGRYKRREWLQEGRWQHGFQAGRRAAAAAAAASGSGLCWRTRAWRRRPDLHGKLLPQPHVTIFLCFYFLKDLIYLERKRVGGGAEGRENLQQAPCWVQSPTWGSIPPL